MSYGVHQGYKVHHGYGVHHGWGLPWIGGPPWVWGPTRIWGTLCALCACTQSNVLYCKILLKEHMRYARSYAYVHVCTSGASSAIFFVINVLRVRCDNVHFCLAPYVKPNAHLFLRLILTQLVKTACSPCVINCYVSSLGRGL